MSTTVSIIFDSNDKLEQEFLRWYQNNNINDMLKHFLLTGYFINVYGLGEYYKEFIQTNVDSLHQEHIFRLTNDKDRIEQELRTQINKLQEEHDNLLLKLHQQQKELMEQACVDKDKMAKELEEYFHMKSQREIELQHITNNCEITLLQKKLENALNELNDVKSSQSKSYDKTLNDLKERYEGQVMSLKNMINKTEEQVEYFKSVIEEKDHLLSNAYKSETKDKLAVLEGVIIQKEAEIKTLKSCNFVKGFTGENLILSFLRENYPTCEAIHTGKIGHEADIQFIDSKTESMIVIESKYKQCITKDDVDKFCRDVSSVSMKNGTNKCVGGLFISLLTNNIPSKGNAHFEIIGNTPCLYLGFTSHDDFGVYFKRFFDIFMALCSFHKSQGLERSSTDEFLDELNFYFNLMIKNKTRIDDFKNNCLGKITKFVLDIESDNRAVIKRIEDILRKNNALRFNSSLMCERCSEVFSNKRLLDKHCKSCGIGV